MLIAAALPVVGGASPSYGQHWWEVPTPPAGTPEARPREQPSAAPAPAAVATSTRAVPSTPPPPPPTLTPTVAQPSLPTPTPEGPRCSIAVLDQPPTEAFDLVAIVEVRPQGRFDTPEASLEAARLQGCALGGDALVIVYREERRGSGMEPPRAPLGAIPHPAIRVAVIRYRQR